MRLCVCMSMKMNEREETDDVSVSRMDGNCLLNYASISVPPAQGTYLTTPTFIRLLS